jgi:hypothetical protein
MAEPTTKIVAQTDPNKAGPFNFDAAAYLASRPTTTAPTITTIEEDPILAKARDSVNSMLEGKLSIAAQKEISRKAAESANLGGIVGPAARAFELRDFGVSVLDQQEKGVNYAQQISELSMQREQANRTNLIEVARLEKEVKQAEDSFALAMVDASNNQAQIALAALDLQSSNRQFRISQENQLIISNSQRGIANLQQNMDSLAPAFSDINRQAQLYIN